jgi:uncharacterized protein (TIGR02145 family)
MKRFFLLLLLLAFGAGLRAQSLFLTAPNGGEVWLGGTTHSISWSYSNVDNIKIEYSLDNGLNWIILSSSYPSSALSYNWTVPCIGSNQVKVRVTNTLQFTQDESNAVFTIPEPTVDITYPNGGESFGSGTGQYIEWATTGVTTVRLQYTVNNGSSWTDIGDFPAVDQYANWVCPAGISSQAKIRGWNIESSRNRDSSAAPFSIVSLPAINNDKFKGGPLDGYNMCPNRPDTIRVLTPNGGETYSPTNNVAIGWSFRHIDQVKIEYSSDNGSSWNLIVNDIPASQLSYNWAVPNTPSSQCRVKITSLRTGFSDISDANFSINAAFVKVLYPDGGESFGTGTGQYIEWQSASVATVKLEYSTDSGSTWTSIGTAPAVDQYANWITPVTVSGRCLVRVSDNALPSVKDQTDAGFSLYNLPVTDANKFKGGLNDGYSMNGTIRDSIRLTSPSGGELWTSASTRSITWTYNEVDNVSIELSLDDGQTWSTLAASVPASQLSYSWTVPTTPSYTCRIRVRDIARPISDESDAVFIIPTSYVQIIYPNGGESFGAGTGQYIEWEYNDLASIKLEYSTDNGNSWSVIGTAPAADKYANWVVPATTSSQILIRATDVANAIYTDRSNAVFSSYNLPSIDANKFHGGQFDGYSMYAFRDVYVKVIKPNGGEIWGNGSTQQIRWATLNTTENLKVEYSTDNESSWTTLLNDVPNNPVTFNWTIAAPVSSICKVRATTMSGVEFDKSDDFFTIANPNGIITNPITGNSFCSGQTTSVNFTKSINFNPGNRFIVQLSDSAGTFNGPVQNIGEITATTPAPVTVTFPPKYFSSSLYRLRVIGTNPPTLGTDNGSNFTIRPLPFVRLGRDTSICAGSNLTLNAASSGATYLWSTGASTSSIQVNQGGTYWVEASNSCGSTRDSISIRVIQPPLVNLGPDRQICVNSSTVLTADSGDYTYLWSTGAVSRSITVVLPGTYSVSASNACGTANDNINISNTASGTVNLGNDRGLCAGETVVLNAGNPGATYRWSTGSTAQSITVTSPGTYSVDVSTSCGTISDQITFYNGVFTVNAGADKTACRGEAVTLSATGGNKYLWNTGDSSAAITVRPQINSVYTVTARNIYGCISTDQVSVSIKDTPQAQIVSQTGGNAFCSGNPTVYTANSGASLGYQWLLNGLPVSSANGINFSPDTTGSYAVKVVSESGCSAISEAISVTVNPSPDAVLSPAGQAVVCAGSALLLKANKGSGFVYEWYRNGNLIPAAADTQYYAVLAGDYRVKVFNISACSRLSATTSLQVNEVPQATISASATSICNGQSVVLQAGSGAGLSYQWQKNGVNIPQANGSQYSATEAGIYSVEVRNALNCSSISNGIFIRVSQNSIGDTSTISATGSYAWNGQTYTSSGTYTWTGNNAAGCDSTSTLILTILTENNPGPLQYQMQQQKLGNCSNAPVKLSVLTRPRIKTDSVNVSANGESATAYASILNDGGKTISRRGFCWGTSANPTLSNSFSENGSGLGIFIGTLSGLNANTSYYIRAYAGTASEVWYGNEINFTASGSSSSGNGLTDIDGNTYGSVIIGNQEWMSENLKVSKFRDGSLIPIEFNNAFSPACFIYDNISENLGLYGRLYNWYSVADPRGLCPAGWHVPSNNDWNILSQFLGGGAGGSLKSQSNLWTIPNIGATNLSGFSALPGGFRSGNGISQFSGINSGGYFWSSTENAPDFSYYRYVENTSISLQSTSSNIFFSKVFGFSVRCLKD